MKINTNIPSLTAQRFAGKVAQDRGRNFTQLASGDRIVESSVDPSGLAISERMKAHIRSGQMARRNVNDAISMIQTAEGTLQTVGDLAIRLKELSLQAANDTLTNENRAMVDVEFSQLKSEILSEISKAEYNGQKLFSGNKNEHDFQIGITAHTQNIVGFDVTDALKSLTSMGLEGLNVRTKTSSLNAISKMETVLDKVNAAKASLGSSQSRMLAAEQNLGVYNENMAASNSRIRDVDYAKHTAENVKLSIMGEASTTYLSQANVSPQAATKLLA